MEAFMQTLKYIVDEVSLIVTRSLIADLSETDALHCLEELYSNNIINAVDKIDQILQNNIDVKMSDSDEACPIENISARRGVPIFFGKGPGVKRLMKQITERGLVYQETRYKDKKANQERNIEDDVDADISNEEDDEKDSEYDGTPGIEEDDSDAETDHVKLETEKEHFDEANPEWTSTKCDDVKKSKRKQVTPKKKRNRGRPKETSTKVDLKENKVEVKEELDDPEVDQAVSSGELEGLEPESGNLKRRKDKKQKKVGFKYKCDVCAEGFNGKIPLAKHLRTVHSLDRPFKCTDCDKCFASIRTLNDHKLVNHTERSANICDICGKSFSSASYLKVHERVHTGERPFTCDRCAMSFKDGSTLRNHYKAIHSSVAANERFECDVCGKSFHYHRYLLNHKARLHTGKLHQCTECGRMFRLKQTLVEHMETHNKSYYECSHCQKVFTHNRSYRRHEKAHLETEPFPCPICGKKYKNKKSAEPHMKMCKQTHAAAAESNVNVELCKQTFTAQSLSEPVETTQPTFVMSWPGGFMNNTVN